METCQLATGRDRLIELIGPKGFDFLVLRIEGHTFRHAVEMTRACQEPKAATFERKLLAKLPAEWADVIRAMIANHKGPKKRIRTAVVDVHGGAASAMLTDTD